MAPELPVLREEIVRSSVSSTIISHPREQEKFVGAVSETVTGITLACETAAKEISARIESVGADGTIVTQVARFIFTLCCSERRCIGSDFDGSRG